MYFGAYPTLYRAAHMMWREQCRDPRLLNESLANLVDVNEFDMNLRYVESQLKELSDTDLENIALGNPEKNATNWSHLPQSRRALHCLWRILWRLPNENPQPASNYKKAGKVTTKLAKRVPVAAADPDDDGDLFDKPGDEADEVLPASGSGATAPDELTRRIDARIERLQQVIDTRVASRMYGIGKDPHGRLQTVPGPAYDANLGMKPVGTAEDKPAPKAKFQMGDTVRVVMPLTLNKLEQACVYAGLNRSFAYAIWEGGEQVFQIEQIESIYGGTKEPWQYSKPGLPWYPEAVLVHTAAHEVRV
jgi:hypothetical protein